MGRRGLNSLDYVSKFFFFPPTYKIGEIEMEITEEIAELLIVQEKIFKENFLKFLKICVQKASEEQKYKAEELSEKINELFKDEKKLTCIFVLSYIMGKAFTVEEYEKIDTFIGNNFMD